MSCTRRRTRSIRAFTRLGCALLFGFFALATPPVSAHEARSVATAYEFVVGFITEPTVAGEMNGVLLGVTNAGQPVEGVSDTLQAQIIFGDQTKDVPLIPSFEQPGTYTSPFIPAVEGDYTFRFIGQLDGVAVDEIFTSSPECFESVRPRSEYEFPMSVSGTTTREVAAPALIGGAILILGSVGVALRRRPS